MMVKLIKMEIMKLKRSYLWAVFFILPIIPAVLGTINYAANIEILQSLWLSLWTQHTLFSDYFFLPIMLGIFCSYLINEEKANHNWNRLLTLPVKRSAVFGAKLAVAGFMAFCSEAWIVILFVISGKVIGMDAPVPWGSVLRWCMMGTLGALVMVSIQLLVSLIAKSFALPVGIALFGSLSGLGFLAKGKGHIYPYSLMAYGMNANAPQQLEESGYLSFAAVCIFYILLVGIITSLYLEKKDF